MPFGGIKRWESLQSSEKRIGKNMIDIRKHPKYCRDYYGYITRKKGVTNNRDAFVYAYYTLLKIKVKKNLK